MRRNPLRCLASYRLALLAPHLLELEESLARTEHAGPSFSVAAQGARAVPAREKPSALNNRPSPSYSLKLHKWPRKAPEGRYTSSPRRKPWGQVKPTGSSPRRGRHNLNGSAPPSWQFMSPLPGLEFLIALCT